MYTNQIEKLGKQHVKHFIGVFPIDRLPKHIDPISRLIVNTDTHNLGGKHWLAVSFEKGGNVFVFDSYGRFYPSLLTNQLYKKPGVRHIHFNKKMYQMPWETNCGLWCLNFLKSLS